MTLAIGTLYSGADAPIFALKKCKIKYTNVFGVENNKHARKFIQMNTSPMKLYENMDDIDIKWREMRSAPYLRSRRRAY